jgi:hypothetical protein
MAKREIKALRNEEERINVMRRDKDNLLANMVEMAPRLIDALVSEEKHRIYGMLGLQITSAGDGSLEIVGNLAGLNFGNQEPTYLSRS